MITDTPTAPDTQSTAIEHLHPSRTGFGQAVPLIAGMAPFGLVVGIAAAALHSADPSMLGASTLLFAGTAEMAAFGLVASAATPIAVLATVVIVNARFLMYGAALEPHFRAQPVWFRWLAPLLIVDQTYAVAAAGPTLPPRIFRSYWLTLGLTVLAGWMVAITAGMLVGPVLPPGLPLGSAASSCLIGLLVPKLSDRAALMAAASGALVTAAASPLPAGLGVLVGTIAGLAVGACWSRGRS